MQEDPLALLAQTTAAWGWQLSPIQLDQFATYAAELQCWNAHTNLTSITDPTQISVRHFLDSLWCARLWGGQPGGPESLIDIGSGAGFPGLPLKLLCPDLRLTLVESVGKKAAFLRHIVGLLALEYVEVLQARAETLGHDPQHRARYPVATARAVADLGVLVEYALPLLQVGGRLLAPKGAAIDAEVARAQQVCGLLGARLLTVEPVHLPASPPRTLVVIEKQTSTPPAYPRAVGVPTRRPLA